MTRIGYGRKADTPGMDWLGPWRLQPDRRVWGRLYWLPGTWEMTLIVHLPCTCPECLRARGERPLVAEPRGGHLWLNVDDFLREAAEANGALLHVLTDSDVERIRKLADQRIPQDTGQLR